MVVTEGEDCLSEMFLFWCLQGLERGGDWAPIVTGSTLQGRCSPKSFCLQECCLQELMVKAWTEMCLFSFTGPMRELHCTLDLTLETLISLQCLMCENEGGWFALVKILTHQNLQKTNCSCSFSAFLTSLHRTNADKDNIKFTLQNHLFLFLPHT